MTRPALSRRHAYAALYAAAVLSAPFAATVGADAAEGDSPAIAACLSAHPDAVRYDQVNSGNDVVCVEQNLTTSGGDDRYYWVGGDTDPDLILDNTPGTPTADPGQDVLSLADWETPWVDVYDSMGRGGMFGNRVLVTPPETVTYTRGDDVIGQAPRDGDCHLTQSSDRVFATGAGADTVRCITGNIVTGSNDDVIIGVTLGSTASAGSGDDYVVGDSGADRIVLGPGSDTSRVDGGGADVVKGGTGDDVVDASRNDTVKSAEVV